MTAVFAAIGGLVVGFIVGFMLCAMLTVAKRADEDMERIAQDMKGES